MHLTNVLVARAPADDDEDYWLAKAVRAPWRTPTDGTIGLDDGIVPAGTWVVEVQWYERVDTSATGARTYGRSHVNQFPLVVRSLVAVSNRNGVTFETVDGGGKEGAYVISAETHANIMRYGNWDYGWGRD